MNNYTYKELKDGVISVYKNGLWQCFVTTGGIDRAKRIFETEESENKDEFDDNGKRR